MSKRSFRIASIIVAATLVFMAGVAWYGYRVALEYPSDRHQGTGQELVVVIERGMSFPRIAKRLADTGIIEKPKWFRFYGMKRGVTTKVRSGRYIMSDSMTPKEVVDTLLEGVKEVNQKVTLPEGLHMLEVFSIFEKSGIISEEEVASHTLEKLGRDTEFLADQGINALTIDGYLFPDTYQFKVPSSASLILKTLIKQHRVVWDRLRREHEKTYAKVQDIHGWNDQDALVMASIVEKEAVSASERPTIAQVFMNRLSSPKFVPHRLDTDPTIRYGCTVPTKKSAACQDWDITDRLHRIQLNDADNPYNTYQHEGLPPGPICSPGADAMKAVMKPDGSKYFFFVAKDAKSHAFAATRAEHDRNVDKYIRGK